MSRHARFTSWLMRFSVIFGRANAADRTGAKAPHDLVQPAPGLPEGGIPPIDPPEKNYPAQPVRRFAMAGVWTAVATFGVALIARARWQQRNPQRVTEAPERVFAEFGRLAQELAHEIRNPLTAINARLYKLQKNLSPGSAEHRDAAIIGNEIKRLDQILEDFGRLRGPAEPKPMVVEPEVLFKSLQDLFAAQLRAQGIELRWHTTSGLKLMADPQQLKQVLINLMKNAMESIVQANHVPGMKTGMTAPEQRSRPGRIVLRARTETAGRSGSPGSLVVLEVEDNGAGVPGAVRSRLLDPFFSTKERGSGLGLAIAARIVSRHGGALEFESQPGEGAIFRVLLPKVN